MGRSDDETGTEYDTGASVTADETDRSEVIVMPDKLSTKKSSGDRKPARGSCCQRFIRNLLFVFGGFIFISSLLVILTAYLLSQKYQLVDDSLTKLSNSSYPFETLTYKQYIVDASAYSVVIAIFGFLVLILGQFALIRLSESKFFKWILLLASVGGVFVLLYYYLQFSTEMNTAVHNDIKSEFYTLFKDKFSPSEDKYFEPLKEFMQKKECCGPFGSANFSKTNLPYMPEFCQSDKSTQYVRGCYEVFKQMNLNTVEYWVPFVLGSAGLAVFLFILLFLCSFGAKVKFSRKKLTNAHNKLKKAINKRIRRG